MTISISIGTLDQLVLALKQIPGGVQEDTISEKLTEILDSELYKKGLVRWQKVAKPGGYVLLPTPEFFKVYK